MKNYLDKVKENKKQIKNLKGKNENLQDEASQYREKESELLQEKVRLTDHLNVVTLEKKNISNSEEFLKEKINKRVIEGIIILATALLIGNIFSLINSDVNVITQSIGLTLLVVLYELSLYYFDTKEIREVINNTNLRELNKEIEEYKRNLKNNAQLLTNVKRSLEMIMVKINKNNLKIAALEKQISIDRYNVIRISSNNSNIINPLQQLKKSL